MYNIFLLHFDLLFNTSSVERGYLYLEIICSPRRNSLKPEHLENLFFILVSNVKNPSKGIARLFKRNGTLGKFLKVIHKLTLFFEKYFLF